AHDALRVHIPRFRPVDVVAPGRRLPALVRQPPTQRDAIAGQERGRVQEGHRGDRRRFSREPPFDMRNPPIMPYAFIFPVFGRWEMFPRAAGCLPLSGNRLPSVMRSLGKSVVEFKKGVAGIEDELDQAVTADKKTPPATPNP